MIPKSEVLDLGCGAGNVSALYREKGCRVVGLDISENAIELAKKQGIEAREWDLNKMPLPFREESFDVVILSDVLEHIVAPISLLKEIKRILKRGGKLIISVPNFARLGNRLRMLAGSPRDILHWGGYGDGVEHLHWFTIPKLRYFLKGAKFRNIHLYPVGLPFDFLFGKLRLYSLSRFILVVAR